MANEIVLRFRPEEERIIAELPGEKGVMITKDLGCDAVMDIVRSSLRYDAPGISSGLLPPRCLAYGYAGGVRTVVVEYPHRYAGVTYHETLYPHFPLPRMVFYFCVDSHGRVDSCRIGIVADEEATPDTAMFQYPFSNMYENGRMCLGENELPRFRDICTIGSLCHFILSLPNNDDNFDVEHNKLRLGYRELMEHLKDKDPGYYYESVLLPSGHTLRQFINGGGSDIEA